MANSTEHPSNIKQAEFSGEQVATVEEKEAKEFVTPESFADEVNQAEIMAKSRVGQLIENMRGKVGPAAQEVLSGIKTVFAEKARQLRVGFEMSQAAKRRVETLGEFTGEEATAHLGEIFGYQEAEFSREETTDIAQDIVQRFLTEHRHEVAELRTGRNEYAQNSRWVFYAQNPQGERFTVEFFRQGGKLNSIDIRKVVSEPGDEPRYAKESMHLIVTPEGKFVRGVISTDEETKLVPAGEAEVLMAGYLQNLEFDTEGSNAERRRLQEIERLEQRFQAVRALGDKLEIAWVGPDANTQVKVKLPNGEVVEMTGGPQQSYLELIDEITIQNAEVAKLAGITVTD